MTFGLKQQKLAHHSGEDSSQSAPGASGTPSEVQPPTAVKNHTEAVEDDICDLSWSAGVPAQVSNEVSRSGCFINVPVGVHVTPAEPQRRNSLSFIEADRDENTIPSTMLTWTG